MMNEEGVVGFGHKTFAVDAEFDGGVEVDGSRGEVDEGDVFAAVLFVESDEECAEEAQEESDITQTSFGGFDQQKLSFAVVMGEAAVEGKSEAIFGVDRHDQRKGFVDRQTAVGANPRGDAVDAELFERVKIVNKPLEQFFVFGFGDIADRRKGACRRDVAEQSAVDVAEIDATNEAVAVGFEGFAEFERFGGVVEGSAGDVHQLDVEVAHGV